MPTPIFVLGMNRSGTTWLANQLCEHPRITGIRHAKHMGIHESAFFSHVYGRYGDIRLKKSNYIEFLEVMCASDYFRLADIDKHYLLSLWPISYEEVFRRVMDTYATRNNADFWVEKSPNHTLIVEKISELYTDAKFIGIIRELQSVVKSSLVMWAGPNPENIFNQKLRRKQLFGYAKRWHRYCKILKNFAENNEKAKLVKYEEMLKNKQDVLKNICSFIGIDYTNKILTESFKKNTSFPNGKTGDNFLTKNDITYLKIMSMYYQIQPLKLMKIRSQLKQKFSKRYGLVEKHDLPGFFFKLHSCQNSEFKI